MFKIICPNCGKITIREYKIKFCSQACSSKYNGKLGKCGGNRNSLDIMIDKYGIDEGTKRYKQRKEKATKSLAGRISPMKNKFHSEETKKLISENTRNSEYHCNIRDKDYNIIYGEGAKEKLKEKMKGTFTLQWFIKKYGEIEGTIKYNIRVENIKKTSYFRKYNKVNKNNYSKKSQKLFWILYNSIESLKFKRVYFSELNHEYSCECSHIQFDFVIQEDKKIIEFNGDRFHANPILFKAKDTPDPYNKTLTSEDIWRKDQNKNEQAKQKGYDILIIWEYDFDRNIEEVLHKCRDFISKSTQDVYPENAQTPSKFQLQEESV